MLSNKFEEALFASNVTCLLGRPGCGKTSFALGIGQFIRERDQNVVFLTNEMLPTDVYGLGIDRRLSMGFKVEASDPDLATQRLRTVAADGNKETTLLFKSLPGPSAPTIVDSVEYQSSNPDTDDEYK